jgi:hypothetical protein
MSSKILLARRGIPFSLALTAVTLSRTANASIPMTDALALSQLAVAVRGGASVAETVSPEVATLFHHGAQIMFLSQLKISLAASKSKMLALVFVAAVFAAAGLSQADQKFLGTEPPNGLPAGKPISAAVSTPHSTTAQPASNIRTADVLARAKEAALAIEDVAAKVFMLIEIARIHQQP